MTETQAQFEPEDHLQHLVNYFDYFKSQKHQDAELVLSWLNFAWPNILLHVVKLAAKRRGLSRAVRKQLGMLADAARQAIEDNEPVVEWTADWPTEETLLAIADVTDMGDICQVLSEDPTELPLFTCARMTEHSPLPDWIVHASNEYGIEYNGFQRGVDDIDKLCLTTHLGDFWKKGPGYNFAFTLRDYDRYGTEWGRPKYGKYLYLVRAPYVRIWHEGDNEPQAIFWGPDAHEIWRIYGSEGDYTTDIADLDLEDEDGDRVEEITAGSLEELADMLDNLLETGP
jgi:hypothetical protein